MSYVLIVILLLGLSSCGESSSDATKTENSSEIQKEERSTASDHEHIFFGEFPANYYECKGGYAEPYQVCNICEQVFDLDGVTLERTEGTGQHQLGENPELNPPLFLRVPRRL